MQHESNICNDRIGGFTQIGYIKGPLRKHELGVFPLYYNPHEKSGYCDLKKRKEKERKIIYDFYY